MEASRVGTAVEVTFHLAGVQIMWGERKNCLVLLSGRGCTNYVSTLIMRVYLLYPVQNKRSFVTEQRCSEQLAKLVPWELAEGSRSMVNNIGTLKVMVETELGSEETAPRKKKRKCPLKEF